MTIIIKSKINSYHEPIQEASTFKCTKCGKEKPLDRFGPNKKNKSGKSHQCKDCLNKKLNKPSFGLFNALLHGRGKENLKLC